MALDIHDWEEGGKSGQMEKEVPEEKEVSDGGRREHMDCLEGVEEVGGVVSGPCDNAEEDEDILKDSVEDISETWHTLHGRNTDEEVVSTGNNLKENKVNHADIGIEAKLQAWPYFQSNLYVIGELYQFVSSELSMMLFDLAKRTRFRICKIHRYNRFIGVVVLLCLWKQRTI